MMDVVSSIQGAIEIAAKLKQLYDKTNDADFKILFAELTMQLADAKLDAANLKSELAEKIDELTALKSKQAEIATKEPYFEGGYYHLPDDPSKFCTACYDRSKSLTRLKELTGPWRAFGEWQCPICDANYGDATR